MPPEGTQGQKRGLFAALSTPVAGRRPLQVALGSVLICGGPTAQAQMWAGCPLEPHFCGASSRGLPGPVLARPMALAFTSPLGDHQRDQRPGCPQSHQEGHYKRRRRPPPSLAQRSQGRAVHLFSLWCCWEGPPPSLVAPGWLSCTPAPSQDQLSHAGLTSRSRGHYVWSTSPGQNFTGRCSSSFPGRAAPVSRQPGSRACPGDAPTPTRRALPWARFPGLLYRQLLFPLRCLPASASASFHGSFSSAPCHLHFPLTLSLPLLTKDGGSVGSPCGEGHLEYLGQAGRPFQRLPEAYRALV